MGRCGWLRCNKVGAKAVLAHPWAPRHLRIHAQCDSYSEVFQIIPLNSQKKMVSTIRDRPFFSSNWSGRRAAPALPCAPRHQPIHGQAILTRNVPSHPRPVFEIKKPAFTVCVRPAFFISHLVGAKWFEHSTPTSRKWCATRLRYAPTWVLAGCQYGLDLAASRHILA